MSRRSVDLLRRAVQYMKTHEGGLDHARKMVGHGQPSKRRTRWMPTAETRGSDR